MEQHEFTVDERTDFVITYKVRAKDIGEARRILKNMSKAEHFEVVQKAIANGSYSYDPAYEVYMYDDKGNEV